MSAFRSAAGVILSSLLAIVLGLWTSSQVIAPVTALSDRLQALDPKRRNTRIAPDFSGAEVSKIAESFDRFMERLDGFVEREQLFTSAAAHELRTPLAVIQGATDVRGEQDSLPPAARRATERLRRTTREMSEFIAALMILSREDRRENSDQAKSEISHIVRQLAEDYARMISDKPVELRVLKLHELWLDMPPALPTIVISNLLRNAVEHTDTGIIQLTLDGRILTISDTGCGISAEQQAHLFDRDFSTKPVGGLGLHLTKRICDRFGWGLTIASTAGKGTTVSVAF
jgi:signal transduction histidine kinase